MIKDGKYVTGLMILFKRKYVHYIEMAVAYFVLIEIREEQFSERGRERKWGEEKEKAWPIREAQRENKSNFSNKYFLYFIMLFLFQFGFRIGFDGKENSFRSSSRYLYYFPPQSQHHKGGRHFRRQYTTTPPQLYILRRNF